MDLLLVPILFYYHSFIDNKGVATSTMRDYVVAEMLHSEIDAQTMKKVFACESGFRQFDSKGKPLMSPTSDVGVGQINQIHWKRAKKLGLDIFNSAKDNVEMSKIIYKEREKITGNGAEAWSCYKKTLSLKT